MCSPSECISLHLSCFTVHSLSGATGGGKGRSADARLSSAHLGHVPKATRWPHHVHIDGLCDAQTLRGTLECV